MSIKTAAPQLLQGCQHIAWVYAVYEGSLLDNVEFKTPDNFKPLNVRLLSIKPDGPTSNAELFGCVTIQGFNQANTRISQPIIKRVCAA